MWTLPSSPMPPMPCELQGITAIPVYHGIGAGEVYHRVREKVLDRAVRKVLVDMMFITCQCWGCKVSHIREEFHRLMKELDHGRSATA